MHSASFAAWAASDGTQVDVFWWMPAAHLARGSLDGLTSPGAIQNSSAFFGLQIRLVRSPLGKNRLFRALALVFREAIAELSKAHPEELGCARSDAIGLFKRHADEAFFFAREVTLKLKAFGERFNPRGGRMRGRAARHELLPETERLACDPAVDGERRAAFDEVLELAHVA